MKSKIAIYLAGSVKKGHEKTDESFWTEEDMAFLQTNLPEYKIAFLNPSFRADNLSDNRSVFGRDMTQVFSSHLIFVDARDRRGLGVGAEMMWAKVNKIPVVTWSPKNSHYSKDLATLLGVPISNFIHPFVEILSDKIVQDLAEGAKWIHEMMSTPSFPIKGIEEITNAMQYYKETQLHNDTPMKELVAFSEELEERMCRVPPRMV